jgi:hypothetical protein
MLFGDKFDFDERAEVGGGLRFGEGDDDGHAVRAWGVRVAKRSSRKHGPHKFVRVAQLRPSSVVDFVRGH